MNDFFTKNSKKLTALTLMFILLLSSFSIVLASPQDDDMPIERSIGIGSEDMSLKHENNFRKSINNNLKNINPELFTTI